MNYRLLFALFLGLIIAAIYLANTGSENILFVTVKSMPYGDKISHFVLMGLLAMLANLALGYKKVSWGIISIALGTLLVSGFVITEEVSQAFIPSRMFSVWDLVADVSGIAFFSWLGYKFLHKQPAIS